MNSELGVKDPRPRRVEALWALCGLGLLLLVLYWPAATGQGVFYVGDIYRLGYPARQAYALDLRAGRVPLWSSDALAGYPVLAEGQTGAYYPLNLALFRLLPLTWALNCSVLLSLLLAGMGTWLLARRLGLRGGAAFVSACIFMLGGFVPSHLDHLNMLSALSWVPWMVWAADRACERRGWRSWALLAAFFGVQGLAGHPQVSLLSALLVGALALFGPLVGPQPDWRGRLRNTVACFLALVAGAVLAAAQWVPTWELTRLSQRGQGLDSAFFTSFSLNPARWLTFLWPFFHGNPYPLTSLETLCYVGILPLVLAAVAFLGRRDRPVLFWIAIAAAALFLALGEWNPVYPWLRHVPLLNMFRAPARYLLWLDLGVALLAGLALDWLAKRLPERDDRRVWEWGAALALPVLAGAGVLWASLDELIVAWRWLPLLWLAGAAALVALARLGRPGARLWKAAALGLLLADLLTFNAVYNRTYNATMLAADFNRPPDALAFLQRDAGTQPYRIFTSEEIVPWLSVMRESLYPNIQLLYGVQSVNGYYPLMPGRAQWLMENLDGRLANLLNVRYVLIPQVLPVDEATEFYDTEDPLAPSIVGRNFDLSGGQLVAALEVEGYLSQSAELSDGSPVAEITLTGDAGRKVTWTLRAGQDLAEWAYQRDDVLKIIKHQSPQVVRSWPARSGFPPRDHQGQTYLARFTLETPFRVERIEVHPIVPRASIRLERLRLVDPEGDGQLLSGLVGEGDHVLVYRNPDVAIYRNETAGPRAFLVHSSRIARDDEEARRLVDDPAVDLSREVILTQGRPMTGEVQSGDTVAIEQYTSGSVRIRLRTEAPGYLVLGDSYYPGWSVSVDGREATLLEADALVRAVQVSKGEHVVEFRFAPSSWRIGGWASAIMWALLVGALLVRRFPWLDSAARSEV